MKKRMLFMIINMNIGGTEKALLNMVAEIPKEKYEVTILMLEKKGDFLNFIPKGVRIEYVKGYEEMQYILNKPTRVVIADFIKQRKIVKALQLAVLYVISKIMKERSVIFKYCLQNYEDAYKNYDIAIAYAGPMDFISYFVANKVEARRKIQWIHFDIEKIFFNKHFVNKVYKKFQHVFVVSDVGKMKLTQTVPELINKAETFLNIISPEMICKMANEGIGFADDFEGVRILTVGRLSIEKGQDLTISVLARLKEAGFNVRWYCIGDGKERGMYEKLVKNYDVQGDYIFLGAVSNPYPFMKQCDLYVQPSRYEGYCITLAEARCFNNPIISTDFTGASEQIIHNHNGLIVQFDEQQMYDSIVQILSDTLLDGRLRENIEKEVVDTREELKKLYRIANSNM
ncbi:MULTISPECIES: glycosyltransferase [Bacillus]|uniref:Glycosyltransferase n=1 Tax=Bacillus wiedmannii TaxID=1890302 RepID=A0A2B5KP81_9BACI|nr:glycosyltransferase [Bacillus wiedmannii]KMP94655.1 galactosyl transferase [Bacillus wiedmannii]PEJ42076.1 glycosyltransferase [Bacillus wiedmannii]PEL18525.1 glycosyltransferase [Bacillus wiedmannii]PEM07251.1 glycosyltransferase [Bacillus wiedmannii]PEM46975.1 glycosyltransferase [Bacillus wiedmannii]